LNMAPRGRAPTSLAPIFLKNRKPDEKNVNEAYK
jgi:hypothetical protein